MKCPNCGLESENNFCLICGIEIPQANEKKDNKSEYETSDLTMPETTTEQPSKHKLSIKKILICAFSVLFGTTFVSTASIGIYSFLTKPDDKLYYHTIGQKINCDGFSITMTNKQEPIGELREYNVTCYMTKDLVGYYDEYSLAADGLTLDDTTPVSETYYEINMVYPIEFTIENHTDDDMEFSLPQIFNYINAAYSYLSSQSLSYSQNYYLYQDNDGDLTETNKRGNVEIPAHSVLTITKNLICCPNDSFYDDKSDIPETIMSQIKDEDGKILEYEDSDETTKLYTFDDISELDSPEHIYMNLYFENVNDDYKVYEFKFYTEYLTDNDDTDTTE